MSNFFRNMVKELGDIDTHIADDELHSSEFTGTIDTGAYILNAALTGSLHGGVPNNKIIAFAGESATGKCMRGNEKIVIYCNTTTKEKILNKLK